MRYAVRCLAVARYLGIWDHLTKHYLLQRGFEPRRLIMVLQDSTYSGLLRLCLWHIDSTQISTTVQTMHRRVSARG